MKLLRILMLVFVIPFLAAATGCSEDIPQAHKGQLFGTSAYFGTSGFHDGILNAGSHYTGLFDTIKIIECAEQSNKETLPAQTKDQVHVDVDIYVAYKADCENGEVIKAALANISPEKGTVITNDQLYTLYIRGALGEAMRHAIPTVDAFDVNAKRDELHKISYNKLLENMVSQKAPVKITAFRINNVVPPKDLLDKNAALAAQQVLKQTAAAQEETIAAQTRAAEKTAALSKAQGDAEAGKIAAVGRALHENPEYLRYVQMQQLPAIYEKAGAGGNLIMLPADTNAFINLPTARSNSQPAAK